MICQRCSEHPDAVGCGPSALCGEDDPACGSHCGPHVATNPCATATTPDECTALGCDPDWFGTSCVCNPVNTCRCDVWTFVCV
jgi:hypothetical protein